MPIGSVGSIVSTDVDEPRPNTVRHATLDFVIAFLIVWGTLTALVSVAADLVALPVDEATLGGGAGLVAFGTTYPFVSGLWSMARLLRFAQTAVAVALVAGLVAALPLLAVGGVPTESLAANLLQAGIVVLAVSMGAVDACYRRLY